MEFTEVIETMNLYFDGPLSRCMSMNFLGGRGWEVKYIIERCKLIVNGTRN